LQEADEEVVNNLPPELVPVWHTFKYKIKGSKRRSRYEAFMDYLHDNPQAIDYVQQRIEKETEKQLERDAAKYYEERANKMRKAKPQRKAEPDIVDDVGEVVDGAFDEVFNFFDDLAEGKKKAA
jgi:transketolase